MSKKQIIAALAKRFADRRKGGGRYWTQWRAACQRANANNWLAQHGRLPEGEHVCELKAEWAKGFTVTVDFTRLMNDPGYPESMVAERHSLPS
ncbi:hypothetical protein [Mesorhizobium sp.]|uniref:hypothetical protein n=1 Tax=Mesorhizobium sp. TaxID=1871066 RepID=UPI000FE94B14|nr:hypothetical protein [Mesorhizobium sp.]RWP64133.1 MAG: hypothetical protein EOR07_16230 [Mesorhizobium sp.]